MIRGNEINAGNDAGIGSVATRIHGSATILLQVQASELELELELELESALVHRSVTRKATGWATLFPR